MARPRLALLVAAALLATLALIPASAPAGAQAEADGTEAALTGITQISAGVDVTCARLNTGQARCWGDNLFRQLGNGLQTNSARPVTVENGGGTAPMTNVTQVSTGGNHSCAVLTSTQVRCWGSNIEGGLGTGSGSSPVNAKPVVDQSGGGNLSNVRQVAAGFAHTCAVLIGGQVRCWGRNDEGELGNDSNTDTNRPVVVKDLDGTGPLTGVAQVSAGKHFTCATFANGRVACWGAGGFGQLGDETNNPHDTPVLVAGLGGAGFLSNVAEVHAGQDHACARINDGRVACWGRNDFGQLGKGAGPNENRPHLVTVPSNAALTGVTALGVGTDHACARLSNSQVRCWGRNTNGQLGDRSTVNRRRAVAMQNVGGTANLGGAGTGQFAVGGGLDHTCVRLSGGQAICVGRNDKGQLGDATNQNTTRPVGVRI